jgi:hypothetical protein
VALFEDLDREVGEDRARALGHPAVVVGVAPATEHEGDRLTQLFAIRNALVHHKPDKPTEDEITPLPLAEFLIAVAEAALRLVAASRHNEVRPLLITKNADHLREWARTATSSSAMPGSRPRCPSPSHD